MKSIWDYNTYDKEVIRKVYADVLADEDSFAFFLMDGDTYHGFCHGAYFNTFWLSGMTCYVSSIITNADERGKGYGVKLMDHAKELAKARGCKALVLDSGMPRKQAHRFYEIYGFEKELLRLRLLPGLTGTRRPHPPQTAGASPGEGGRRFSASARICKAFPLTKGGRLFFHNRTQNNTHIVRTH